MRKAASAHPSEPSAAYTHDNISTHATMLVAHPSADSAMNTCARM